MRKKILDSKKQVLHT